MTRDASDAHSILPLAVLEAIRHLDSPSDEEVAEFVDELLKKRLGLSGTVTAQIGRYGALVRVDGSVRAEEYVQILRLVGRRPDATLVFADGGRRAARYAIERLPAWTRLGVRYLPGGLRRAVGFRAARRTALEVLDITLTRRDGEPHATLRNGLSVRATGDGASCGLYAASLAEALRHLIEFEGSMIHSQCMARGDAACEWRATGPGGVR